MKITSVKQGRIRSSADDEQDYFDNLIKINRNSYKPTKMGHRLHMSLARTRICRGGLGSGKTRTGTEHINNLALRYPRSTHLIGRKDLTSLKETTQKEFLEKVVDRVLVDSFNVNDNKLIYKNGSEILFRELKEPDKVKSLELTSYLIDEADENPTPEIWGKIDDRLRQKIEGPNGWYAPPYAGLLVFNPTNEDHWLYQLSIRKDIDIEDLQFSTYDNIDNLPPDYIPNLLKKLPPWEVERLVFGNWGRAVHGLPVYHGFTRENNVRLLKMNPELPLLRGWDFGYGHPAVTFCQIDHTLGRVYILREYFGTNIKLEDVVCEVKRITSELVGATRYPTFDYGDPHGADEKDSGPSSIEYLRLHHGIHVIHRRERIKTGMEEIQHKISTKAPLFPPKADGPKPPEESLFLVDPSCRVTITAFEGGYHRDSDGVPEKDGKYDHLPDAIRYLVVNTMNRGLQHKFKARRYKPSNIYTGY